MRVQDGTLLAHMMTDAQDINKREFPVNSVHSVAPDPYSLPDHLVVSAFSTCGQQKKTCKNSQSPNYKCETNTVEAVETR